MNNWYIGQDIVAVRNHSKGKFKIDEQFIVEGINKCPCKCGGVLLDIGVFTGRHEWKCSDCNSEGVGSIEGFSEQCFVPLDSLADISELTEVLTETKVFEI